MAYSKIITLVVNHEKFAGQAGYGNAGQIQNYPLLVTSGVSVNWAVPSAVSIDQLSAVLKATVKHASGYDILFSETPDGLNPLPYERVKFDQSTGEFAAWVRVPFVHQNSDVVIYILVGDDTVTVDPSTNTAWDSNFAAVYHFLPNGFGGVSGTDSTANGNHASVSGGVEATLMNGILPAISSDVFSINCGNAASLDTPSGFTLEVFFKMTGAHVNGVSPRIAHKYDGVNNGWDLFIGALDSPWPRELAFAWLNGGAGVGMTSGASNQVTVGRTYHLMIRINGSNNAEMWLDGARLVLGSPMAIGNTSANLFIGEDGTGNHYFPGMIGEFRLSSTRRESAISIARPYTKIGSLNQALIEPRLYFEWFYFLRVSWATVLTQVWDGGTRLYVESTDGVVPRSENPLLGEAGYLDFAQVELTTEVAANLTGWATLDYAPYSWGDYIEGVGTDPLYGPYIELRDPPFNSPRPPIPIGTVISGVPVLKNANDYTPIITPKPTEPGVPVVTPKLLFLESFAHYHQVSGAQYHMPRKWNKGLFTVLPGPGKSFNAQGSGDCPFSYWGGQVDFLNSIAFTADYDTPSMGAGVRTAMPTGFPGLGYVIIDFQTHRVASNQPVLSAQLRYDCVSGRQSTSSTITNTTDQTLYNQARSSGRLDPPEFHYKFKSLPNATGYTVNLKFAELNYNSVGDRVFDVKIQDTTVLSGYDIIAVSGAKFRAQDESFSVDVVDGTLLIEFISVTNYGGTINAIEIIPPSEVAMAPIRVNCGGVDYIDTIGQQWDFDYGYGPIFRVKFNDTYADYVDYEAEPVAHPSGDGSMYIFYASFSAGLVSGGSKMFFSVKINGVLYQTGSIAWTAPVYDKFLTAYFGGPGGGYSVILGDIYVTNGNLLCTKKTKGTYVRYLPAINNGDQNAGVPYGTIRLNCGNNDLQIDQELSETSGLRWENDYGEYFSSGTDVFNLGNRAIAGTSIPQIYRRGRYEANAFTFMFPRLPNATGYTLTLMFSEPDAGGTGERLFHVDVQGTRVLTNFDIYADIGAADTACDKTFSFDVTDNTLTVTFTQSGGFRDPFINGIQVTPPAAPFDSYDNWKMVAEVPADSDLSAVEANNSDDVELYQIGGVPSNVKAYQVIGLFTRSEPGSQGGIMLKNEGGVVSEIGNGISPISNNYRYRRVTFLGSAISSRQWGWKKI